jgi:hypothetical protein
MHTTRLVGSGVRLALVLGVLGVHATEAGAEGAHEIRRFRAAEARQGVAVDAAHVYAIDSAAIGKYEKQSGRLVGRWAEAEDGPVRHLNSGVVLDGVLYCAASNYPDTPPRSAIEVYETRTMRHATRHALGVTDGWATWIDFHQGARWVVFAHYGKMEAEAGKGSGATTLVRFDASWRPTGKWTFPAAVLQRFGPAFSNSGGAWGRDDLLYVTGHDAAELYVLRLPLPPATVLEFVRTVRTTARGQGIAWDRTRPGILYAVDRPAREVVAMRVDGAAAVEAPSR